MTNYEVLFATSYEIKGNYCIFFVIGHFLISLVISGFSSTVDSYFHSILSMAKLPYHTYEIP